MLGKLEALLNGDLHDVSDGTHRNVSISYLKPLLRTHYIYVLAPLLSEPFLDATLRMDTFLSGIKERPPRVHKCATAAAHALSALADQAFVSSFMDEAAAADGWALLVHLKSAFIANLEAVDWMDNDAKVSQKSPPVALVERAVYYSQKKPADA